MSQLTGYHALELINKLFWLINSHPP